MLQAGDKKSKPKKVFRLPYAKKSKKCVEVAATKNNSKKRALVAATGLVCPWGRALCGSMVTHQLLALD